MFEPSSPTETSPPPPAYEFSQREFDQKVSTALERSLAISPPPTTDANDDWQEWDEAAYQAAAARLRGQMGGSSSSSSSQSPRHEPSNSDSPWAHQTHHLSHGRNQSVEIKPLNIQKKAQSSQSPPAKERPSWYEDAQLGASGSSSSSLARDSASSQASSEQTSRNTPSCSNPPSSRRIDEEQDDDTAAPPPPFAHVDTSLDGPTYERVQAPLRQPSPAVVLRYAGDPSASPEPSPPQSPVAPQRAIRHSSPPLVTPQRVLQQQHHMSLPPARKAATRPSTSYNTPSKFSHIPPPPRMDFDPAVAYGARGGLFGRVPPEPQPSLTNVSAFYNSAVAAHLTTPQRPMLPPPPPPHTKQFPPTQAPPAPPVLSTHMNGHPLPPPPGAMHPYQAYGNQPPRQSFYASQPMFPPQQPYATQGAMMPENRWPAAGGQIQHDMYNR